MASKHKELVKLEDDGSISVMVKGVLISIAGSKKGVGVVIESDNKPVEFKRAGDSTFVSHIDV